MAAVKDGDTIRIHYVGTLDDGSEFDSSRARGEPIQFKIGSGKIIRGLDAALRGMEVGETKIVTVAPEDAYGPVNPGGATPVERSLIPEHVTLEVGMPLQVKDPTGKVVRVHVTEIGEETVVLDTNHPLAGKALTFDVEVVEIL